ncbi:MAG: carbon-nitrogen hydrolase [Deltaproteobacteria bacterium CG11_big_fil_rev_8_21_14_0_20_47_16]|nr:MAG: carbon-nitrogen hydrolase [Deltaproteobacteria bacterium CG11_big_fil_rev_8_21_14_0_20_47_16]
MTKLNLKDFEKRLKIRRLEAKDFKAVAKLQEECFPGIGTWKEDQFLSQLEQFPEGQICVELNKQIVASSSSLIVDFSHYTEWHNWKELSDNGFIRNHDPNGDTLYGIEIMVSPKYRGYKLARRLYIARKEIARAHNLAKIIIGGRIPGYGKRADKMSAREYVEKVLSKRLIDPVLTPQIANGFTLKGLIQNYFPSDSESRGYATFLEWVNLDYVPKGKSVLVPMEKVRVSAVQYLMRPIHDFSEFAKQSEFFVDVASDYRSDFVVFPELFTLQMLSCIPNERPGLAARKLAEYTPEYLDLFNKLALKYNVNIIGGSQFSIEDDKLYNISYMFHRDGRIGKQYKIHITPDERRWWGVTHGSKIEVFQTDRGKVAILICYDVEFPELARYLVEQGVDILFVPFNTENRQGYLRVRYCAQARAVENQVYVAIAGCVGNLPDVENADIHYAQSGIFTPSDVGFERDGIAAECNANIETVVTHDIDLAHLRRSRLKGTVRNWHDRRKDLYEINYKNNDK